MKTYILTEEGANTLAEMLEDEEEDEAMSDGPEFVAGDRIYTVDEMGNAETGVVLHIDPSMLYCRFDWGDVWVRAEYVHKRSDADD
jgi:hypothetical protein